MKKVLMIIALSAFSSMSLWAQNENDALRYSMLNYDGTARTMGLSNAFGSLGGDMTAIGINPAGLAFFNTGHIEFTPAFLYNGTKSNYDGSEVSSGKLNFHVGSIGWAQNYKPKALHWSNGAFAISYNRTNNFNNQYLISGKSNDGGSLLDYYVNELNANGGTEPSNISSNYPFDADLAYETYLINPYSNDSMQYFQILDGMNDIQQTKKVVTKGGMGETAFSWAANYNNRLFIGAAFDISNINYNSKITYSETSDSAHREMGFKSYKRTDNLTTKGTGIDLKFGLIYRIKNRIRVGLALQSPTWYRMEDTWNAEMDSKFDSSEEYDYSSPKGDFQYGLTTPFRARASLSYFFGDHGLLSVDYEYVNYTMARLRGRTGIWGGLSDGYNFKTEDAAIENKFASVGNLRVGGEWRLSPLYLRAGFQYQPNPYTDLKYGDLSSTSYSLGVGYRKDGVFIDLAYQLRKYNNNENLYTDSPEMVNIANDNSYITLTIGYSYPTN